MNKTSNNADIAGQAPRACPIFISVIMKPDELIKHYSMFKESIPAILPEPKKKNDELPVVNATEIEKAESLDSRSYLHPVENEADRVKEKILSILKENGILQNIDEHNVFDMEKFLYTDFISKNFFDKSIRNPDRSTYDKRQIHLSRGVIFEKLSDLKVVSKEDYEKGKMSGEIGKKFLFNVPENINDAFNVEKCRDKEKSYYLNYWNLYNHTERSHISWNTKIKAKNGEEINLSEFALFTKVFGDNNGRRDGDGNLLIFNKSKNKFVDISVNWAINNMGGFGKNESGVALIRNPQKFLLSNCPNLLERGIIRLEDFDIKTTGGSSGELIRKEFTKKKNSPFVMANGVKYYIGRDYFKFGEEKIPAKNLKIVVLDQQTLGILKSFKNKNDLMFTVKLLCDEEKQEKVKLVEQRLDRSMKLTEITQNTFLSKEEMDKRTSSWLATKDNPRHKAEKEDAYHKRIKHIGDWNFIKQISDDFTRKCQIGIHNLTWREQQWLCGAAFEMGNDEDYARLLDFGKRYGLAGLKSFLACEHDISNGRKILNIGEKMGEKDAQRVFAKIAELVDLAEKESEELADILLANQKDADMSEAKFELLKNARDAIVSFSNKLESGKQDQKEIEELLNKLEQIRGEITLFKSIFRQVAKEHPEFGFDYFKSLELASQTGREITEEDKETMIGIIEKNWSNQDERKIVFSGLEKGLHSPDTIFEILRYKGEIISFLRFDRGYDEQNTPTSYFGSFNTDSNFQGAAIGDVMMKECVNSEAELSTIKAHCFSTNRVASKYIEDAGFIITGIALNYAGQIKLNLRSRAMTE